MERGKRIEAVNGLILLPEAIIQHIQSFLSGKEAAQTAVLSKSWYSAWSTRPNLDFDQREFRRNGADEDPISRFSKFARKTMRRYRELNRNIESFRLCVESTERDSYFLANELILKAMRMGTSDLNVEFMSRTATFVLQQEVFGGPIRLYEFHKLKYLFLKMVKIGSLFFSDFSSKFPCLKDLTVHHCDGYKNIQICSPSLECASFVEMGVLRAKFYVPRIHKFSFSDSCLPALSFETTSREWESDISILHGEPGTLSLCKLKKFLENLSQSKVSLSLNIGLISEENFEYVGDVVGLPRPRVENLMLLMDAPYSVFSALLDCLFWSCRPKFITSYRITSYRLSESRMTWDVSNDIVEILCKRLVQQVSQNCYIPNRNMFGQDDLEEVNVEYFEETLAEWRPLPWKTLLDASTSSETEQKIRFQLRWGQ